MEKIILYHRGKNKRINTIDFIRLICAVMVTTIHATPFFDISQNIGVLIVDILSRIAVPFFFTISGYFLVLRIEKDKIQWRKAIRQLLKYYICLSVIYFGWEWIHNGYEGYTFVEGLIVVLKRTFIYGVYYHLWYFPSSIMALSVLYLSQKLKITKIVTFVALFCFIGGVLTYTWSNVGTKIFPVLEGMKTSFDFDYIRRFVGDAFPFTILGYVIFKTENLWKSLSKKIVIGCCVFSLLLYIMEVETAMYLKVSDGTTLSFSMIFVIYFLFMTAILYPAVNNIRIGKFCRDASVIIFGLHPIVLELLTEIYPSNFLNRKTVVFIIAITLLLILTICIDFIKKTKLKRKAIHD